MNLTIKDVARLANVSRTTVSRVLNNKPDVNPGTRQAILEIIKKYNFQPNASAQAITSKKSSTIGLIIPYTADYILGNSYYAEVIKGISKELNKRGYFLLFCYTQDQNCVINMYKQRRVDGFIILSPGKLHKNIIASLGSIGAPLVSTSQIIDDDIVTFVDVDNYSGATLAVEHLVSLGHKKIGFIMNCNNILACSQDRFRGYRDVLARNGIDFDGSMTETGDLSIRGGYEAMRSLLRKNSDITAVFIAADMMAIGAIKAIKDSGKRVPEDISVIGFDDIPESEFTDPPLTTIRQPGAGKGEKAAHLLINLLEKKVMMKSMLLDIELQRRKSTNSPCK